MTCPDPCPVRIPPELAGQVPEAARGRLLDAADLLLKGEWEVLGHTRHDMEAPDWFLDPVSGRRAPHDRYAFAIDHRSEEVVGNIKQVWELSRHHHITVLAAAWFVTRDDRYAERAAVHLRSWWDQNPFLSGVHWTSGIELGIRLIAWTWARRLLDAWPGVGDLFEGNEQAARQLHWHHQYLAAFVSTGSSANNHVIAEAAGQLVASAGLPWFPESDRWRREAAALLDRELNHNTFPSGVNRELATAYHGLVAELGGLAAWEADAAGRPLTDGTWSLLTRMFDAAASLVDTRVRPPRQGDSDDGLTLVLDGAGADDWASLLALGGCLVGRQSWWPAVPEDVRSTVLRAVIGGRGRARPGSDRPEARRSHFADAGITLLRTPAATRDGVAAADRPEIWCRCDAGPHGFLSIAAHAHADALSIEVRHDGVDVFTDPGTYCYHGDPEWRAFFRSTIGHNTLEVCGHDQSRSGGPFLWVDHAASRLIAVTVDGDDGVGRWAAEHDGYAGLNPPAVHHREVTLDTAARRLTVVDRLIGAASHPCRLAFHLGPAIEATLADGVARLHWPGASGQEAATVALPQRLAWTLVRGATAPVMGWYSPRFGVKEPTAALVGAGLCGETDDLVTRVEFDQ